MKLFKRKKEAQHTCKRFKTVIKRKGIRLLVACRECGKERVVVIS